MGRDNWSYIEAETYCVKVTDGTHDSPKSAEFGKPLITSKHIKGRNIDFESAYLISEEDYEKANQRSRVDQWDVLISMIGEYCGFCYVERNKEINYAVKNVGIYKTGSKLKAEWLYYYLNSSEGKKQLLSSRSGSSQPYITLGTLRSFQILFPNSEKEAQGIVNILSALDTKIEINQHINAELESMAKTLYDYWFVQFDFPNEKDKPYKSAGGEMVWNEALKREIPLGWEVESIEKCCEIIDCLHSKKPDYEFEDERYYLLQLENIRDDGLLDLTNKYFVPKSVYKTWISRVEVTEDDILITNAGRVAATAQIPKGVKSGIGRNITAIRPTSVSPTYLFLAFRGIDIRRQIKGNTDSGAFFSSFNVKGIKKLFILRPKNDIEKQFEKTVKAIRCKRELNIIESQTLTELRDWLLPMLMNGQVKVG